ncbi:MAG: hypothetical protein GXP02_00680 [Alphaproteobacteria bacterium]|nr:hypothetical protein [Alphaproteobacteria bacterium]
MNLSNSVIITKLAPPVLRQKLIPRTDLLATILEADAKRLLLISAGAGFGKTTFMVSLFHEFGALNACRAWISLDADERNEIRFLRYLITALSHDGTISTDEAEIILESQTYNRASRVMTAVINEMANVDRQIILFLDDYHLVDGREVGSVVDYLLSHAPANFRLIIASRTRPDLTCHYLPLRHKMNFRKLLITTCGFLSPKPAIFYGRPIS